MHLKLDAIFSTLNNKILKLVDQSTYLGSNISSIESNVNICIGKAWTAIDRSTIWKSNPSDKIKQEFFQVVAVCYCMAALLGLKVLREKATCQLYKNAVCYLEQILEATPHKTVAIQPLNSHLTKIQDEQDMLEKPA